MEAGDKIHTVDGVHLEKSGDFVDIISRKIIDDEVTLSLVRDEEEMNVTISIKEIPKGDGRVGLGVQFV